MIRPFVLLYCTALSFSALNAQPAVQHNSGAARAFGKVPLTFEENRGQTDSRARYLARSAGMTVFLTGDGYTLSAPGGSLSMHIAGANRAARVAGDARVEGISNYYLHGRAITGIPHFQRVRAYDVRPAVDAIFYGQERRVEYDFVFRPGSDPRAVALRFEGAGRPEVAANGDLVLRSGDVEFRHHKPAASQDGRPVECAYSVTRSGEVRFAVGPYDKGRVLTIDPILSYSTFLGGTGTDNANAIAVDSTGAAYITGFTNSTDFPVTSGAKHGTYNNDAFVTKLSANGASLIYSTYIGGNSDDVGYGIAADASGNAYITGSTYSSDFVLSGYHGGTDAFVMKLGPAGTMIYTQLIGGPNYDEGRGIAVDSSGNAYVTGSTTSSTSVATPGAYQTTLKGYKDAFVAKVGLYGGIVYCTYLGGAGEDYGNSIAVDASGNTYVTGLTSSSDFPVTSDALDSNYGASNDAFVAVLNAAGTARVYSSYLGGTSTDEGKAIALDGIGGVYVAGSTSSTDFPTTPGSFASSKPGSYYYYTSGFVTKFVKSPNWSVAYSTYIGSNDSSSTSVSGLAVDGAGQAYIAGTTSSGGSSFPTTPGALKTLKSNTYSSDSDIFVSELTAAGDTLVYSTLLGSSGNDTATGIAFTGGAAYVTGYTTSRLYPTTPGAFEPNPPGNLTASIDPGVVSKIDLSSPTLCNPQISPTSVNLPGRGGTATFNLTLAAGCPWEAIADSAITINGAQRGMGSSAPIPVSLAVSANDSTSSTKTTSVRIGAATFTVNQSAWSCTDPVFSPASFAFDASGGIRTLSVSMPSACTWTAVPSAPWVSITSGQSGSGSRSMTVYAAPNSYSGRSASIAVGGQTVPVTQAGGTCTATATASPVTFAAGGGAGTLQIVTASACTWAAYASVPWVQVNPAFATGQGNATIPFTVAQNPGIATRGGAILIGDRTVAVNQSGGPAGNPTSYTVSLFAGGNSSSNGLGDGGPASSASLWNPANVVFSASALYIADQNNNRIRAVTADGNINTAAGGGASTADGVAPLTAMLTSPYALAVDRASGLLYFNDGQRVRTISGGAGSVVATFAGSTTGGFSGDNGPAASALFNGIFGIALDASGSVYIADNGNGRIRKVSGGTITTFAGGGSSLNEGGGATTALLRPRGVAVDAAGNVYISDSQYSRIRKVSGGIITTFAGGGNSSADGVPATSASLSNVGAVTVDGAGNVYFSDYSRLLKVGPDGLIYNLTANNYYNQISGIAADDAGNVYFSESYTSAVRKLTPVPVFCTYTVSTPPVQPIAGGSFSINVTTATGCTWQATTDPANSWVSISGGSGTGNGSASVTVTRNRGGSRAATVFIAGQAVTIVQAGIGGADFDKNGVPDLVWQSDTTHQVTVHYFGGSGGASDQGWNWLNTGNNTGWRVVAIADFNSDGVPDLVWQNDATRQVTVHYYGGASGAVDQGWNWLNTSVNTGWRVVAAADFNGDGVPDLVWQNDATRQVTVNYYGGSGGAVYQGWNWLNAGNNTGWRVAGAADFNGDGVPDLIWQSDTTRQATVHYYGGSGGAVDQSWNWLNTGINVGWHIIGAADFNGDGTPDLVWQNDSTRQVTVNYYGGTGGAVYQGWNWLYASGAAGWSAVN
jgi:Beta-propeller repeat/FG-GAP-like repeat/Viral BACON domain